MEKLCPGVYQYRIGSPEALTPLCFREFAAKPIGSSQPPPFTQADIHWRQTSWGLAIDMPLEGQVFGFGLQLKGFNHTRQRRVMRNNADAPSGCGESHAPVPFYVTTAGYGVMLDTARCAAFYTGRAEEKGSGRAKKHKGSVSLLYHSELLAQEAPSRMYIEIPCVQGVDLYLFSGSSMMEAVQKYNMFCGGGVQPPEWGLGVWYRAYAKSAAKEWVAMARRFEKERLPIRVLGLEPGWQTRAYPCSFVFNEGIGDCQSAIKSLHDMGLKVNLWEHCYTHPDAPFYEEIFPYCGSHEVWGGLVPDFALPEAREIFARHMKTLGADCFKLDECDGSDHTGGWSYPDTAQFPSGLDGDQMHHLLGLLYQQAIHRAFPGGYHSVRASQLLASPYPFVLYSDLYAHQDFIRGVVNAGFSGLLWAPEVRHASSVRDLIRRLQTALFSPQMLINAWYLPNPPWEQIDREKNAQGIRMEDAARVTDMVRALFRQREKMIPYLLEQFAIYRDTGKPVFRALVMDFTEDPETWTIDDQYLVGDRYLFAPITASADERRVYLPQGEWLYQGRTYGGGWHDLQASIEEYLLFERMPSGR